MSLTAVIVAAGLTVSWLEPVGREEYSIGRVVVGDGVGRRARVEYHLCTGELGRERTVGGDLGVVRDTVERDRDVFSNRDLRTGRERARSVTVLP